MMCHLKKAVGMSYGSINTARLSRVDLRSTPSVELRIEILWRLLLQKFSF